MVVPGTLLLALALSRFGGPRPSAEGEEPHRAERIRPLWTLELLGVASWLWPFALLLTVNTIELSVTRCSDSNLGCGYYLFGLILSPYANFVPIFLMALGIGRLISLRRGGAFAGVAAAILFLPSTALMVYLANTLAKAITG